MVWFSARYVPSGNGQVTVLCRQEAVTVASDGLVDTKVERVGDECVSDADLVEPGEGLCEGSRVVQIEVVSGIESKPEFMRFLCGGSVGFEGFVGVQAEHLSIGSGV